MKYDFRLKPVTKHADLWVFSWDDETGEVSGPSASIVREIASWGGISVHPPPGMHRFSKDPLRNKTDMAAIIGWEHELPPELEPYYPSRPDSGIQESTYIRDDGVAVIGRDYMKY